MANKSDSIAVSNDELSGDYLPMANIVHLITWRNTWVWALAMLDVPLSEVFTLGFHLCLRTGGRGLKFVRVGYKASL